MTIARHIHWVGVFLLFTSSILLLITTISSPVINDIGLLKIHLHNRTASHNSTLSFGTFGYCILDAAAPTNSHSKASLGSKHDWCTKHHIGYAPAHVVAATDKTHLSEIASGTSDGLTRVMVLHPVACGVAFIAFLTSIGAGIVGSLVGALVGFIAWVLVIVTLAVDFSLFGIIRHHVNKDHSGSHAEFGGAIWTLVAAFVTLFWGVLIVAFTCFSARKEKKRAAMP